MSKILKDRSFRLSIILTLTFLSTGIVFLLAGLADYSWVLFVLLPVVLGLSIGALPNRQTATGAAVITVIAFLLGLLMMGLSGFICIFMTLPIVVPLVFVGSIVRHLINRYIHIRRSTTLPLLFLPLLPFVLIAPSERLLKKEKKQVIEVRTEQVFNYTPRQVYDAIKSVDTLTGKKPFLMHFDLPVPVKCILDKEEVGGTRTCYFNGGNFSRGDFGGGTITERITRIEPAKALEMDVIDYQLIGRKWLGFKTAIYRFEKMGSKSCKLTRITTYTSELTPRFYWEPLEKLGVRQEHEYVFSNLVSDLERKQSKH